jgi:hypothetical protein
MQNGNPPLYDVGQMKLIMLANKEEHWLQYKGELLLPKATDAMQKLLNCLFIVDQTRRPTIDNVRDVLQEMERNSFAGLNKLYDALFPSSLNVQ